MNLFILLKANIKHRKSNFISIFLLMLIISSLLTAIINLNSNLITRAYEGNNSIGTGDLILFLDNRNLTDDMIEKAKSTSGVKKIDIKNSYIIKNVSINNTKLENFTYLQPLNYEKYPYRIFNNTLTDVVTNKPELKDNEILLPITISKTFNCKIGDTVSFKLDKITKDFKISGFIEEPFLGSDILGVKNFIISKNALKDIKVIAEDLSTLPNVNEIIIDSSVIHIFATTNYENNIQDLSKEINKNSNIVSCSFTTLTKDQAIDYTLLISNILSGTLLAFVLILLIILILVLSNNISTSISIDYKNIGILKSQGFTKNKIQFLLLCQYLLPGFIASILGLFFGIIILKFLRNIFLSTTGLFFSTNISVFKSFSIILLILLFMAILILIKTKKLSTISPIVAISNGIESIYFKNILETPIVSKSKTFINVKLGFRQVTSNLKQYLGVCTILSLLVLFLALTTSFKSTFTEKYYNELFGIVKSDILVEYNQNKELKDEVESIIEDFTPIKSSFYSSTQYFLIDNVQYYGQILNDGKYLKSILNGRSPKYNNEIVITNLVSNELNKSVGDKVSISFRDTKKEFIISGIYDSCSDMGRTFALTFDGAKELVPNIQDNRRNYIIEDSSKIPLIIEKINKTYLDDYNIKATKSSALNESVMDTVLLASNMLINFIYFISLLFTIIVVTMVCKKIFLKEQKDIAIYKSFGFTSSNLKLQFLIRFLIVSLISSLIGTTLFILFGTELNSAVLTLAGISNFESSNTLSTLLLPATIVSTLVGITSYIVMAKIKKIAIHELISTDS